MSASYRAVTSLLLVGWLLFYTIIAWFIGGFISEEAKLLPLLYYPIAGLAWIPGAVWLLKKRHKEDNQ